MSYQRSQTPTTAPLQAPAAPQSAPTPSPFLGLQGLIGNAGVLDLLRPQMSESPTAADTSPLTGPLQTVLQQDATAPTPPPGGTEAPSTAVAATLADEGQTAALTSAPSSPAQSASDQVCALDETQGGVEGAITDSPALTTAVAAELGTTPSDVAAQAEAPWQPSWWDEAVDWTVGGAGSLVDGGVDLLSDVPMLGTAAATMAPVTKFAWETLGGFAKGAGDLVGGFGHMVAHPLDTLGGLATMAEHIPGSPLKPLHKLYDVATTDQTLEETFWRNPLDVAGEDLSADWDFWKGVGGAILDPYERSVEQGKYGEALGRGIFDIGGLFLGASEAKALGKGAEAASAINKVDDAVKVAGKMNEVGAVTDDLVRAGGKADDVTKAASHVDEVARPLLTGDEPARLATTTEEAARTADQLSGPATDQPRISQVSSGGKRNELPITPEQQAEILDYTRSLGVPDEIVRFSENMNTSYAQFFGEEVLYVGTDVLPAADEATRAASANARVSWKGAIAHEAVGHREAALAGKTQESVLLEEAQASVRAARLGPDLSRAERFTLLRDAVERLHAGGISVRDVKDLLWTE